MGEKEESRRSVPFGSAGESKPPYAISQVLTRPWEPSRALKAAAVTTVGRTKGTVLRARRNLLPVKW